MNVPALSGTLQQALQALREMAAGGSNAWGSLTLRAGATSTPIRDDRASDSGAVLLTPTSANAAAAGAWVSAKTKGSFMVSHPAAAAGCTFDYLVLHG